METLEGIVRHFLWDTNKGARRYHLLILTIVYGSVLIVAKYGIDNTGRYTVKNSKLMGVHYGEASK